MVFIINYIYGIYNNLVSRLTTNISFPIIKLIQ